MSMTETWTDVTGYSLSITPTASEGNHFTGTNKL